MRLFLLCLLILSPWTAHADIETARNLLEAGRYSEAHQSLKPAAQSGNADAENLIAAIYALGLGVEKDPARAFNWYLRAAHKGHPGAQSSVGWHFEHGLGLPAPDLARAYIWYALATIGGDPDAEFSQHTVGEKLTQTQIVKAHEVIADYKIWLYPFLEPN